MTSLKTGVAISTTGDKHRIRFLETCVEKWDNALSTGDALFVTVDGDDEAVARVEAAVGEFTGSVFRVGQGPAVRDGRMGVAVSKNTGLELLMQNIYWPTEHLFLSDDDTWPLSPDALALHTGFSQPHSMVMWGAHRKPRIHAFDKGPYAEWSWPRGVVLYAERYVVEHVGGMDERFGPGGHEHVDWSRRIYQAGLTPVPYLSPTEYVRSNALGARPYWHAEDMPRPGETLGGLRLRKRGLTTIRREAEDWTAINALMTARDGNTAYVPYHARANGRRSATLCGNPPVPRSQGEEG